MNFYRKRVIVPLICFTTFALALFLIATVSDKKITGYQVLGGGPMPSNNFTLRNDDTSPSTYPVSIGRPFVKGEIQIGFYPQVFIDGIAVPTQVDVKNTWPDGSLRFAVLSFVLSLNQGETKTASIQPTQNTIGNVGLNAQQILSQFPDFDAKMELTQAGQTQIVSARTMLQNGHINNLWLSGPIVTTVELADHSVNRAYDLGWKQTGTRLVTELCSTCTLVSVNDASIFSGGQTLNLNNEIVIVQSIDTSSNPDTITILRGQGGLPPKVIPVGSYITSNVWQTLNLPTDDRYRSFRPSYIVSFYPTINQAKIRYIGENTNTETLQDLYYSIVLKKGFSSPVTVHSQNGVSQHIGSRWSRVFWLGSISPKLSIDYNNEYLALTGYIDNYHPSIIISNSLVNSLYNLWLNSNHDLMEVGIYDDTANMGTGGFRPEMETPKWTALRFLKGDYRLDEIDEGQANLAGAWIVHFREGDPTKIFDRNQNTGLSGTVSGLGRPVSPNGRPTLALEDLSWAGTSVQDKIVPVSRYTHGELTRYQVTPNPSLNWQAEYGHLYHPSLGYILNGDLYFVQQTQFWASYTSLTDTFSRGPNENLGGGAGAGLINEYGSRYQATPQEERWYAYLFSPSLSIEEIHFKDLFDAGLATWMGMQNIPFSQEPGFTVTPFLQQMWQFGQDYYPAHTAYPSLPDLPSPISWIHGNPGICENPPVKTPSTFPGDPTVPDACHSSWFDTRVTNVLAKAKAVGYPVNALLSFVAAQHEAYFTTPGVNPILIGAYRIPTVNSNGQPYVSLSQAMTGFTSTFLANLCFQAGGAFCDGSNGIHPPDSYFSRHYAAATQLKDLAPSGYNWFSVAAQLTFNAGVYNNDPRFGLAPRPSSISCTPNSGPFLCSTSNSGVCNAGTYSCNSVGNGYTGCVSTITPGTQVETCNNLDDDCDGIVDESCSCSFFGGTICLSGDACVGSSFIFQSSDANCCGSGGTCQQIVLPTGLVSAYAFSEGIGNVASDSSGNSNHGSLMNSPIWSIGKYDNGLLFDGVNDYVEVPNSVFLNPAQLTLSAWLLNPASSSGMVMSKGDGSQYQIRLIAGGIRFRVAGSEINVPVNFGTGWHHVAATFDGVNLKVYYDGVLVSSLASSNQIQLNSNPLFIGARIISSGLNSPYNGGIDEVRIYNRALSLSEIMADMNSPMTSSLIPAPPSNLNLVLI